MSRASKAGAIVGRRLLNLLGFPNDWELTLTQGVMSRLAMARVTLQKVFEADRQIAAMKERLATFDPLVRTICAEPAEDLLDKPAEVAAATLRDRLTQLSRPATRSPCSRRTWPPAARSCATCSEKPRSRTSRFQNSSARPAAADPAGFRQVAEFAQRIAQLETTISAKEHEVAIGRENEPPESFAHQLREADVEVLDEQLRDLSTRLETLRAEKTAADQNVGSCQRALTELEKGSDDAARIEEEAASNCAQLASAVDRYVPLLFARHLLQRAIQRFEQESQPEMLRDVSRIFQSMTGDRYSRVERPLDESARSSSTGKTRKCLSRASSAPAPASSFTWPFVWPTF